MANLDRIDRRLLAELQDEGRVTNVELAHRVGLTAPPCLRRVRALEDEGIIRGYHADVDPRALGLSLGVVIRVRPAPRQIPKVAEAARASPEVVLCERITGEDCFVIRADVRDVDHLEELIDRFTPFGQTTTSVVQSAPVPRRGPHVEA